MKRIVWLAAACWLVVTAASAAAAMRIAALAPSLTELAYAAGAGPQLVAVSAYSDAPDAARMLPRVADANGVQLEALAALRPDLVLVWSFGTREADIVRMKNLGMRVEAIGVHRLADVPTAIRRIAAWAGTSTTGETAATDFERRLQRLAAQRPAASSTGGPSVFFEISALPLMTVNGEHFISDVLAVCGLRNVFADERQLVFEPSRESLLLRAPDYVFHTRREPERNEAAERLYVGTPAMRRGRVIGLDPDRVLRPGPRLVEAVAEVCEAVRQREGWR